LHVPLLEASLRIVSFESFPELKSFAVFIAEHRGKYIAIICYKIYPRNSAVA
jgi:hypothetical protein